jgi:hypothetical protein
VEAVREFEAERDQQGDEQQDKWHVGCHRGVGRIDIDVQAVGDEQQSTGQNPTKQDHGQRIEAFVEIGPPHCGLNRAR